MAKMHIVVKKSYGDFDIAITTPVAASLDAAAARIESATLIRRYRMKAKHCDPVEGQPSRQIERIGRDAESAIAAWNRRASPASAPECVTFIPDRIRKVESGFKGLCIKEAKAYKQGWNDCRAAMLAAAPTPPVSEDRKDAEHVPLKPASAEDIAVYQQIANNFKRSMQDDKP